MSVNVLFNNYSVLYSLLFSIMGLGDFVGENRITVQERTVKQCMKTFYVVR